MMRTRIMGVGAIFFSFLLAFGTQSAPDAKALFEKAKYTMESLGDLEGAIKLFRDIVQRFPKERETAAKSQLYIGLCYQKAGVTEAQKAFQSVVDNYPEQAETVRIAREKLALMTSGAAVSVPKPTGIQMRKIVVPGASDFRGALTPDGKSFIRLDGGTGDVVLFDIADGQTKRTKNSGPWNAEQPAEERVFSRDGRQIVYGIYTEDDLFQLRIRNLDGSGQRPLCTFEKGAPHGELLDWSPDGRSVLALRGATNQAKEMILISTADGSARVLKRLTSVWGMYYSTHFSADGRFIAFSFVDEGIPPRGEIFLMAADGGKEIVVAGHPAEDQLLDWAPDGHSLIFLSNRSGTWDIWAVAVVGGEQRGEPELLKKDFGNNSDVLGLAPDGSLYYKTTTRLGGFYSGAIDLETGKVLVPPALVTTRFTGPPYQPEWSPDGKNLLYIPASFGWGGENGILAIRSAATGEERFLASRLRYVNQVSWASDSRSVLALGFTERESGIFQIDAETGGITKLQVEAWGGRGLMPRLCPDGKTLVFVAEAPSLRKRNLDTGEESEIVKNIGSVMYDLSPDGREVVYQADGALRIASLNGGKTRELFRGTVEYHRPRWTRDGRFIIAQALGTANSEIWRIPVQGGTPLKLDLNVPKLWYFTLHPDNRRFMYSVNEGSKSELWVMENFLPQAKAVK